MITRTFLDSFSTADFTRDYVIILRTTDILFDRLGGMRFLSTVSGRCFHWGTENTSANLHSKFARCTVTFRGLPPRRVGDRGERELGTEEWTFVCGSVSHWYFLDLLTSLLCRKQWEKINIRVRPQNGIYLDCARGQFLKSFYSAKTKKMRKCNNYLLGVSKDNVIQLLFAGIKYNETLVGKLEYVISLSGIKNITIKPVRFA